jgi:hypothetical protein
MSFVAYLDALVPASAAGHSSWSAMKKNPTTHTRG